jgi:flagellar hook assembly protein FlgD
MIPSYELTAAQSQVTLEVVDEQGKVIIRQEQGRQPAGRHTHQLQSLQEASPGTYFIRLKLGGDKQQVERVVKVE